MVDRCKWLAMALGAVAVTGCADITGSGTDAEVTSLPLFGGEAVVTSPSDYCIAPGASSPATGFAVMGRCADAAPGSPEGFVTVQMGPAGSGLSTADATALEDLLQSEAGRGLLSSNGAAAAVTVETTEVEGDAVTVRFRDRGPAPVEGVQATEWRGFFDVGGRLATVSVRGLTVAPMGTDDGEVLLARTIAALRTANGVVQ